ncbi:SDR family oxidoreductase [Streptomyces violaceorubidus]
MITGAGSGIGAAVARRLRTRRRDRVQRATRAAPGLAAALPGAKTLVGDLAEPGELSWALSHQSLPDRWARCSTSPGRRPRPGRRPPPKTWLDRDVDLVAPAELTRLLLPQIRVAKGQVLFVNSGSGLNAHAGWAAYGASKPA